MSYLLVREILYLPVFVVLNLGGNSFNRLD